jgi:hypothetical protein
MDVKEEINRTCSTCGHKSWSICMLSGYSCTVERKIPTICGKNFEGWVLKPKKIGFKNWLLSLWYGE